MADPDDPGSDEPDPEELQRQLADIKGAMGLVERYPGRRKLWLVYGVGIGVAIVLLQLLFALPGGILPNWAYQAFVLGFALIATLGLFRLAAGMLPDEATGPGLDWRVFFGTLLLALGALVLLIEPAVSTVLRTLDARAASRLSGATAYGLVVAVAGTGFLFAGNALRAHSIRRRDRWVFYGAGLWMLAYAALFTQVHLLRAVGYGVFGCLLVAYSVGAYVILGRGTDDGGRD